MVLKEKLNINYRNIYFWFIICIFLFVFRTAIPFFKYPFIISYIIINVYCVYKYRYNFKQSLIGFFKYNIWTFLLTVIIIVNFLFSSKIHLIVFKDVINLFILLNFYFLAFLIIVNIKSLKIFIDYFLYIVIGFAIVISLSNIFANDISEVHIDYNFALMPIFFGFLSTLNILQKKILLQTQILLNTFLLLFTLNILLSSSRRGMFLLFMIILILIVFQIITLIKRKNFTHDLSIASRPYLIILMSSFFLVIFIFSTTSFKFKNKLLEFAGINNIYEVKKEITSKIYRYFSFFNEVLSFDEVLDMIWSQEYDPNDPQSGWGTRKHHVIYPLKGTGVEIVPENAKGYLMDSTCNANTWNGNAYSYTKFTNLKLKENEKFKASVYCYVSEDFDGAYARIKSEGSSYDHDKINDFYDLEKKGTWQKLKINPKCKAGEVPIYLYFAKYGVTDFSTLKGYVIFAYPQYKIIKKDSIHLLNDSVVEKDLSINIRNINQFPLAEKQTYQKASLFNFELFNNLNIQPIDKDPIRNWIANLVAEDTTYYPYQTDLIVDSISDNLIAARTARWQFAWQIFTKEYSWAEKIFGRGFDFLNWYGYYFLKDKTKSDWPHNPFLTVLLYSGVVGLVLYLVLLHRVFYLYIKYIKEYYLLFIFFLICFYFSFFSSINPFNPPVTGFFVMLPFLIHAVHNRDLENKTKTKNT